MKVVYWDVVSPDEIGTKEFRRELEIPDGLVGGEAAMAASELVDKSDFTGPTSAIGEKAVNYMEIDGVVYCVDKRVVVQRSWRFEGEKSDFGTTAQLQLPIPDPTPSVEYRVFRVITRRT